MSVLEEAWQTARSSIKERTKFMFNNDLLSDVKFFVPESIGVGERKVIPAHRFVLSISSPVFLAMFNGDLAETHSGCIDLPDCEYRGLLEFFRYVYSDVVHLKGSNVLQVLYLAKKYMVPSLADKCLKYLEKKLHSSNVFSILPHALRYDEKDIVDLCWMVVDEQTDKAVKTDSFVTIPRPLLEILVERDTISIEEAELFKAVNFWATKECDRLGLEPVGETKRRILGERIVKGLRFPVMTKEEFIDIVLGSNILKPEESSVMKYFDRCLTSPSTCLLSKSRETVSRLYLRCCRFKSIKCAMFRKFGEDRLNFMVDKEVMFYGVKMFGVENRKLSVTLRLREIAGGSVLVAKTGIFSSELVHGTLGHYYGFDVFFASPIVLLKDTSYCIHASIGLRSVVERVRGENGVRSVESSGVRFIFRESGYQDSGTGVLCGQFPELLFRVCL